MLLFTSGILYYGEWCRFVCVGYHIWKKLLLINTEGQIVITISYSLSDHIWFPLVFVSEYTALNI